MMNTLTVFGQGYSFNTYYGPESYGPGDELGFPQNWKTALDPNDLIQIGSGTGIISYNGLDWVHNHVGENGRVVAMLRSHRNEFYVASTTNFGVLKPDSVHQIRYESISDRFYSANEQHPIVWNIHEYDGIIFFSHLSGIGRFDPEANSYTEYPLQDTPLSRTSFQIGPVIYKDGASFLWAFQNGAYTKVPGSDVFSDQDVQFAVEFSPGKVLIGTTNIGENYQIGHLWLFDGQTILPFEVPASEYLRDKFIFDAIRIDEGTIAIASILGGVLFMKENGEVQSIFNERTGLHTNEVYDLFLDAEMNLWMGLSEGIQKLSLNPNILVYPEWSGIKGTVTDIASNEDELYLYNFPNVYRRMTLQPEKVYGFEVVENISGIFDLYSWNGEVYMYGSSGIYLLQGSKKPQKIYEGQVIEVIDGTSPSGSLNFIGSDTIIQLRKDGQIDERPIQLKDQIGYATWFKEEIFVSLGNKSGASGIGKLGNGKLEKIPVEYDTTAVFTLTKLGVLNGKLFVSGEGAGKNSGLFEYDPEANLVKKSTFMAEDPDIQNKQIFNFVQCSEEEIWFVANKKLLRVSLNEDVWKSYRAPYQQVSKSAANSIACSESGIWVGSTNQLSFISNKPWEFERNFKTNLSGVYIERDSLIYGGYGEPDGNFRLKYSENELRFRYTAPSYISPEDNEFQVKLVGFDEDWSDWNREPQKDYTNIPEGEYTFMVRGRDVYDVEGEAARFSFEILPPWYRTWWAYLLYFLSITGSLFLVYRIRINQLLRVQRIRNNIASDLHDEVSATLSSISYFAQAIKNEDMKGDKNRFVNLIANSAGDAKEKITDIVWAIDPEHDNWEAFLAKCRRYASDLLESKEMKYSLKIDENIPGSLDMQLRQHLWLIFKEMVTNAVRHSEASQLDVIFNYKEGRLRLIVQDNGNGMDVDKIRKGNGLVNIHNRADLIGAKISLKTSEGFGTRWSLIIPV